MIVETFISNKIFKSNSAYVYIWFSKNHKIVYVGMTNNRTGTLGRAAQHLDLNGTLRQRFQEMQGYSINQSEDLILFSFLLPDHKEFITVEKSYREAVEYLVQKELIALKGKLKYPFEIVSWVRSSPRISNKMVKDISADIVSKFTDILNSM